MRRTIGARVTVRSKWAGWRCGGARSSWTRPRFRGPASRQVDTGGDGVLALRRQTRQPVVSTRAQSSFASSRSSVESSAPLDGNIRWSVREKYSFL
jgi:hypothetical protein